MPKACSRAVLSFSAASAIWICTPTESRWLVKKVWCMPLPGAAEMTRSSAARPTPEQRAEQWQGRQRHERQLVHRLAGGHRPGTFGHRAHRDGQVVGHEHVVGDPGVAAGAPHAHGPPGLLQLHLGHRHHAQHGVHHLAGFVHQERAEGSPGGLVRAGRVCPAPAHPQARPAPAGPGPARFRRQPSRRGPRTNTSSCARSDANPVIQLATVATATSQDAEASAAPSFSGDLQDGAQVRFVSAQPPRGEHPEQPGFGEREAQPRPQAGARRRPSRPAPAAVAAVRAPWRPAPHDWGARRLRLWS